MATARQDITGQAEQVSASIDRLRPAEAESSKVFGRRFQKRIRRIAASRRFPHRGR